MNEFLRIEYEQCLALVKYYDERHHSLVKFATGISSAIPSLLLAIYQLGNNTTLYFWQFTLVISLATSLGLLSIFTVLTQNRLYFIYPTRQVNAIRKHQLNGMTESGFENQMYLSTSFNAFKLRSTHTLLNLFIAAQSGIFIGLSAHSLFNVLGKKSCIIGTSIVIGIIITIVVFSASSIYLHQNSKSTPDKSIHRELSQ